MERIKLKELLDKHIQKFYAKNRMARFDDIPNDVFIDAMEEAINFTGSSLELPYNLNKEIEECETCKVLHGLCSTHDK